MKNLHSVFVISILIVFVGCSSTQDVSQNQSFQFFNPDTVKSQQFDMFLNLRNRLGKNEHRFHVLLLSDLLRTVGYKQNCYT